MPAMYKLHSSGKAVILDDGSIIPEDTDNADWDKYQKWLDFGNTPEIAVEEVPIPAPAQSFDTLDIPSKALALTVAGMLKIPADQVAKLYQENLDIITGKSDSSEVVLSEAVAVTDVKLADTL